MFAKIQITSDLYGMPKETIVNAVICGSTGKAACFFNDWSQTVLLDGYSVIEEYNMKAVQETVSSLKKDIEASSKIKDSLKSDVETGFKLMALLEQKNKLLEDKIKLIENTPPQKVTMTLQEILGQPIKLIEFK